MKSFSFFKNSNFIKKKKVQSYQLICLFPGKSHTLSVEKEGEL